MPVALRHLKMPENHAFAAELVPAYRQTLDGRLLDCNTACARLLGYGSREELLATGRLDYFNLSDHLSISAALPDLVQLPGVEVALRRKDGSIAWVLQNMRLVRVDAASKEFAARRMNRALEAGLRGREIAAVEAKVAETEPKADLQSRVGGGHAGHSHR